MQNESRSELLVLSRSDLLHPQSFTSASLSKTIWLSSTITNNWLWSIPTYKWLTGNIFFRPQRKNSFLKCILKSRSSGDVTRALMSCIHATYFWKYRQKLLACENKYCRWIFQFNYKTKCQDMDIIYYAAHMQHLTLLSLSNIKYSSVFTLRVLLLCENCIT